MYCLTLFWYFALIFKIFGLKRWLFGFLHEKPCRSTQKFHQQINLGSPILLSSTIFSKIVVFDLQTMFFDGKTMFFRFLAEIRLRTFFFDLQTAFFDGKTVFLARNTLENAYTITSKSNFSTHFVQIPYHLHPALRNSLQTPSRPPFLQRSSRFGSRSHSLN